jgi:hypothetical protein
MLQSGSKQEIIIIIIPVYGWRVNGEVASESN